MFHGFHGFHGSIVDFTGLAQKQPISRTRDTVKKEGPCTATFTIVNFHVLCFNAERYL